jgi:hypothetical protein
MQPAASQPPGEPYRQVVSTTSDSPTFALARIVYVLFGILEGLIGIRLILKALGANPDAGFTAFIYGVTAPSLSSPRCWRSSCMPSSDGGLRASS